MRDTNGQPIWNLYLEQVREGVYRLIMPNTFGEMDKPAPQEGIAVSWPVNPHFTGRSGIIEMLQQYPKFQGVQIN